MKNNVQNELVYQQFIQREYGMSHPTYDSELAFYNLIKNGDIEALKAKKNYEDVNMPERGTLSKNYIKNLKYHIIVTVAMVSRFCIEGGLDEKVSYGLSDIYINRIDQADTEKELRKLHKELLFDFAKRMNKINSIRRISIHCIKAMDYICDHLHEVISVKNVADYVGLDRTYFGKLFHRETGESVAKYIRSQKIQAAQNMLLYSDFSCAEIAQYLAFASHSHFSDVFKKHTGMTPSEYRNAFYRKHWESEKPFLP